MQGFKLVQKLQCIEENMCHQLWERYNLKNLTLSLHQTFPMMRAWDRKLQESVVVEFIPRGCILNMLPKNYEFHPYSIKEHCTLANLLQVQHPNILGVQDVFYCERMRCLCIVYAVSEDMVPLHTFLGRQASILPMKELLSIFKQVLCGLEYLYRQGTYVDWFNFEDVFVTVDKITGKVHAEIRYIKLGYRRDAFHMFLPPEFYFPELLNKDENKTSKEFKNSRLSWQLGILLVELLRGRQFIDRHSKDEYIHTVDQICNYFNNPELYNRYHLSKEISEVLMGLTAVGIEERWHVQKLFDCLWVSYYPSRSKCGLEREDQFEHNVQVQLQMCLEDEEPQEDLEDEEEKEAKMKEVVEEYVQFYQEAKELQERNRKRRKSQARRMSLSECYFQVMQNKNLCGALRGQIQCNSLPSESTVSEDSSENTTITEDLQSDLNNQNRYKRLTRLQSSPALHIPDIFAAITLKWGRCMRKNQFFEN
eukprot:TRINITY_DN339_c1_g1_i2.p1 TRINITY_DN339_c1_g1~~TRINITY_DN339_c1_g1_i2.p1  ORF type:complete len:506 (+),score=37.49 TRINITY_DN339_c1_g1_i2:83-1519(+)